MTAAPLITRILAVLGGLVVAAGAAEGLATLLLLVTSALRDQASAPPVQLDPAVGCSYAAASGDGGASPSRFFTLERFGPAAGPALRILALGGSTTDPVTAVKYAGRGGDWPRQLGATLADRGVSVDIANAGMLGSLAAQELTRLLAIVPDHEFDLVISLTGINETYFADRAWYRNPDDRMSPKLLLAAFAAAEDGGTFTARGTQFGSTATIPFLRRTAIARLMSAGDHGEDAPAGGPERPDAEDSRLDADLAVPHPPSAERLRALEAAADAWYAHARMMAAVCREYGVRYAAVLQPALGVGMSRADLVALLREARNGDDAVLRRLLARPGALESVDCLYAFIRDRAGHEPWFHDFSGPGVLPYAAGCFHSPRYPNARGNGRIASRMAEAVVGAAR